MKIEQDKPLPSHTKIDYNECCAKLILEELFPDRYSNLLLADKPDLQGSNVGIEVTIANDPKMQEALNDWIKAYYCTDPKLQHRYIERMQQLGVTYTGGVQAWPTVPPTFSLTKEAAEKKILKLKSGNYRFFQRYELFIFTDIWYHEGVIKDAKKYFFSTSINDFYKTVYVLSQGSDLHVFETDIKQYRNIKIDTPEQSNRNIRARSMVEEAEDPNHYKEINLP